VLQPFPPPSPCPALALVRSSFGNADALPSLANPGMDGLVPGARGSTPRVPDLGCSRGSDRIREQFLGIEKIRTLADRPPARPTTRLLWGGRAAHGGKSSPWVPWAGPSNGPQPSNAGPRQARPKRLN